MTHIDIPIFHWPIRWDSEPNGAHQFNMGELRIGFGPELLDIDQSYVVRGWVFSVDLRDEAIEEVNAFMDAAKGRANPFWVPGPPSQFQIVDGVDDKHFLAVDQDAASSWQLHPGVYLWFTKVGEEPQVGQVNDVEDMGDGTEKVTLSDELFGEAPDETWRVQPLYLVRNAEDFEEVQHRAERWQVRRMAVVELPHDYDRLEPGVPVASEPVFLYRFTAKLPDGDVVWRFTSYKTDVTLADLSTWMASGVEHDQATSSAKLGGTCTIRGDQDTVEPLRLMVPQRIYAKVMVEVLETTTAFGAPTLRFTGVVRKPTMAGLKVQVQASEWGGQLDEMVPRMMTQRECPYAVYDPDTCRADKPSKQVAVTVTAAAGRTVTIAGAGLAGLAVNWFAHGWVEWGAGTARRVLFVMSSSAAVGTSVNLTLSVHSALEHVEVPQAATAVPGCTGERSVCIAKFDNLDNFGGAGTPRTNLTLSAIKTNSSTGGKK